MKILHATSLVFFLLIVFVHGEVSAKEITVNEQANLQQILDSAEENDVIILEKGVYKGNFTISKSMKIIGEKGATIKGPNQGNVITIDADDVTIENLQIEGGGTQNAGIYVRSNRNILKNNIIYNVFHGIQVRDGYGNEVSGNLITSFKEDLHEGYGVYLIEAPYSKVNNNLIYETNDGIYISFSDLCEVSNNKMEKTRYGIHTMDSENVVISQNQISNSRNGLMIMQSYAVRIKENYLYSNRTVDGAGMFIFDTFNSTITANIMKMNNKGIYLENAIGNNILFNSFEGNDKGMEIGVDSKDNRINLNNFVANNQQVISSQDNENSFSRDGYGNYWDNQQRLNINRDEINDYAYKSGNVFYHLTTNEPYLQIFTGSPAVQLWNTIEQFVPIPSKQFITDENPLVEPANIEVELINHSDVVTFQEPVAWQSFVLFFGFSAFGILIMWSSRRKTE